jgi:hypothetical protein
VYRNPLRPSRGLLKGRWEKWKNLIGNCYKTAPREVSTALAGDINQRSINYSSSVRSVGDKSFENLGDGWIRLLLRRFIILI